MKLTFCGGAQAVTGANYLIEGKANDRGDITRLVVDCGLPQGEDHEKTDDYGKFEYDVSSIEAVLITHAHIDHIGRLPFFYKAGFRGQIYSTRPTKDVAEALLTDSQGLLLKEAEKRNRPVPYTLDDVDKVMAMWHGTDYHKPMRIREFEIEYMDAGHILGSAFIKISAKEAGEEKAKTIIFSGDLGNVNSPLVKDTEKVADADYVVMEALYGDRFHEGGEGRKDELEDVIEETVAAGGVLMIPAFAMERTQELLYEINDLVEKKKIPRVPIFIDSPLAIRLIKVYERYLKDPMYMDSESIAIAKKGDGIFDFPGLKFTMTSSESKAINEYPAPKIIIAGSGMSHGGRMIHHELRYLSDPKSTLLFIGYQAVGTLGRRIIEGEKLVRIFGEDVHVRCRVESIRGYSAHADRKALFDWLKPMKDSVKKVFLVQSEEEAAEMFARKVRDELALDTMVPEQGYSVEL